MRIILICLSVLLVATLCIAQEYVGDSACATCHSGKYDSYMNSGHPYKITHTAGEVPGDDTWPHTPVPPLPSVFDNQLEWSDVEYVIGNFYWKARFIDRDGYIYTGSETDLTQWNLHTEEWVGYHAGDVDKPFDCGRCHTTGYEASGHQLGLEGLIGTWAQDGVRCEACHGPGSEHIANPQTHPENGKDCDDCHYRDDEFRMPWKGGFGRHHQQAEDLSHSPHSFFDCSTCHEPHRSVLYNDGGIPDDFSCSNCHEGDEDNGFYVIDEMENVECISCHMPKMTKNATVDPNNEYVADVAGHMFRIMTDPIAREDNTVEIDNSLYWAQDGDGNSYATLDYACFSCHLGDMTLQELSVYADGIHDNHPASVGDTDLALLPDGFRIVSVYPNPFNPTATITIELDKPYVTKVIVYDALGRAVTTLIDAPTHAGTHQVTFDGHNLSSGIYFVRLTTGAGSDIEKMILMK
ncbi:MAG TPA: T9SS type A sorting domain-containing protein [Bacteroidetes bacterium]|nr:hypothetical protein BMS3Bbin04_01310 [bacterium BMS3Bbin04]HDO64727.1 T9SS type A sorting domain-containing protein [Bacteroidota bacterium]HEX03852.1 T9SS type A sorting domain-containing protein [Bacteroidota bacterium]